MSDDGAAPEPMAERPGLAARASALIAVVALALMTLLTLADVGGRLLGLPVRFAPEVSGYALVAIIFCGLAWTDVGSKHVAITLATERLAPRLRSAFARFVHAASTVFVAWLVWFTAQPAIQDYQLQTRSLAGTGWPMWAVEALIPIGLALLCLRLAARLFVRAPAAGTDR